MAVIIPFADADAHGSICDTVTFRRSRGRVVFQKKPKPKQPNTQAQKDQKQWFKNTWNSWRQLTAGQLAWLAAKAAAEQTTPANYYFDNFKDTHGASGEEQYRIKSIEDIVIDNPIGAVPLQIVFAFAWWRDDPPLGQMYNSIYDNQNIWVPSGAQPVHNEMWIELKRLLDPARTIPDNYSMTIDYTLYDDTQHQDVLYFPELELGLDVVYSYYLDTSMSMYSDRALTNLVKENFWPYTWPPF